MPISTNLHLDRICSNRLQSTSTPTPGSDPGQPLRYLPEEGRFTFKKEEAERTLAPNTSSNGNSDTFSDSLSTAHHTVAVFGLQRSGKSTLLNHTFCTNFKVLAPNSSPQPTTEGMWWCTALTAGGPVLVIDVEGCDSNERNDNLDQKCALFALTVSDVVVFNVSRSHVLRRHGSAMTLMHRILKIMLCEKQFRQHQPQRALMVVVRDLTGTPLLLKADTLATTNGAASTANGALASANGAEQQHFVNKLTVHLERLDSKPSTGLEGLESKPSLALSGLESRTSVSSPVRPSGLVAKNRSLSRSDGPGLQQWPSGTTKLQTSRAAAAAAAQGDYEQGPSGRVPSEDLLASLRKQLDEIRGDIRQALLVALGGEGDADRILEAYFPKVEFRVLPDKYDNGRGLCVSDSGELVSQAFQSEVKKLRGVLTPGGPDSLLQHHHHQQEMKSGAAFKELWDLIDRHQLLNESSFESAASQYLNDNEFDTALTNFKNDPRWTVLDASTETLVPDFMAQAQKVWCDYVQQLNPAEPGTAAEEFLDNLGELVTRVYSKQLALLRSSVESDLLPVHTPPVLHRDLEEEVKVEDAKAEQTRGKVARFFDRGQAADGLPDGRLQAEPWKSSGRHQADLEQLVQVRTTESRKKLQEKVRELASAEVDDLLSRLVSEKLKDKASDVLRVAYALCLDEARNEKHVKVLWAMDSAAHSWLIGEIQRWSLECLKELLVGPPSGCLGSVLKERYEEECQKSDDMAEALKQVARVVEQFALLKFVSGEKPVVSKGHGVVEYITKCATKPETMHSWQGVAVRQGHHVILSPKDVKSLLEKLTRVHQEQRKEHGSSDHRPSWLLSALHGFFVQPLIDAGQGATKALTALVVLVFAIMIVMFLSKF